MPSSCRILGCALTAVVNTNWWADVCQNAAVMQPNIKNVARTDIKHADMTTIFVSSVPKCQSYLTDMEILLAVKVSTFLQLPMKIRIQIMMNFMLQMQIMSTALIRSFPIRIVDFLDGVVSPRTISQVENVVDAVKAVIALWIVLLIRILLPQLVNDLHTFFAHDFKSYTRDGQDYFQSGAVATSAAQTFSGRNFVCGQCSKRFGSEDALHQH